jgi:aminopeptidase
MWDPRFERWADVLVRYCLSLNEGDIFKIDVGGVEAQPLVEAVYRRALEVGAHPYVRVSPFDLGEIFYETASEAQLTFVFPHEEFEVDHVHALLTIWTPGNLRAGTAIDPARQAKAARAREALSRKWMEKMDRGEIRWTGTLFPTVTQAQESGMSLRRFREFVFHALHLNDPDPLAYWKEKGKAHAHMVERLSTVRELHLIGEDTDLHVRVEGRKWISDDGRLNFPGGEVFTSPLEHATEGVVTFNLPSMYSGREVEGVRLVFEEGRVVKAEARKGEAFLREMLALDEGASRLGEFAIGTNENIQSYVGHTLFDEKIGGTVHMALGHAFPQAGGKNTSALHWDLVFDLRQGGELRADGEPILVDGVLKI